MKTTPFIPIAILSLLLSACAGQRAGQHQPTVLAMSPRSAVDNSNAPPRVPLYLHLLAPRYYTDPPMPARRIVTTKVWLAQDFAISIGGEPDTTLAGRIDQEGGKYLGRHLSGVSNGTKNVFDGEMELEKPFRSQGGLGSGAIWSAVFVLSTNSDCTAFLKQIDPGTQ